MKKSEILDEELIDFKYNVSFHNMSYKVFLETQISLIRVIEDIYHQTYGKDSIININILKIEEGSFTNNLRILVKSVGDFILKLKKPSIPQEIGKVIIENKNIKNSPITYNVYNIISPILNNPNEEINGFEIKDSKDSFKAERKDIERFVENYKPIRQDSKEKKEELNNHLFTIDSLQLFTRENKKRSLRVLLDGKWVSASLMDEDFNPHSITKGDKIRANALKSYVYDEDSKDFIRKGNIEITKVLQYIKAEDINLFKED